MAFTKSKFGIFWSLPADNTDWENLRISGVKLVMLMLTFADQLTLARLRDMGCSVILRVSENDYYGDDAPAYIAGRVLMCRDVCPVTAVIIGNEPDHALSFEYGSGTWGQHFAYLHRQRFDAARIALQGVGIKVVSPALIMRSISEDEPPAPGRVTWREIVCLPDEGRTPEDGPMGYLNADYNGAHIYGYGWDGPVDVLRFLFALKYAAELWHKPLILDEVGITGRATPLEKMRAYIGMAELLLSVKGGKQHPLGLRVEALIPFVANGSPGNPPAWSPGYLLRDRACYEELGRWMSIP